MSSLEKNAGLESPGTPATDPPTPGGCLRRWLKGGCGCGALGLGALVVLLALAPRLAGGWLAGELEREFAARQAGRLEVPSPALRWSSPQRAEDLRLFDPEGRQVAVASLEFPPIWDLLSVVTQASEGGVLDLGHYELTLEADLIVDEEGRTNLEAALAPKQASSARAHDSRPSGDPERDPDTEDNIRRLQVAIDLHCPRLSWTDPRLDVPDRRATLHDVHGELRWKPGGLVTLELRGEQECETRGPFQLEASLASWQEHEDQLLPGEWHANLSAGGLSGALVDRLGQGEGEVGTLLGDSFAFEADLTGGLLELERASVEVRSEALRVALVGGMKGERFQLLPDATVLELDPRLAGERLVAWSAKLLPEGMALVVPEEGLELKLSELALDLSTKAEEPLQGARMKAALALGPLGVRDPFRQGSEEVLFLEGLAFLLEAAPGDPLSLRASLGFADQPGSRLELSALLAEDWVQRAVVEHGTPRVDLRIEAEGVPLDRLRRLALAEDPTLELFGTRLALTATARAVDGELGPFQLEVHTDTADLTLDGELAGERATLTGSGLVAELRAPEAVFADLVRAQLPEGHALTSRKPRLTAQLAVTELELDLAGASPELPVGVSRCAFRLELGGVDYTEPLLESQGQTLSMRSTELTGRLTPDGLLRVALDANLVGQDGGVLHAELESTTGALLLAGGALDEQVFELRAEAERFPTRLLDAYAEQDGLLVDVLGPRVRADVASSAFTTQGGPLVLNASSDLGTFHWQGDYTEGALVAGEGGRLDAAVGLSPLFRDRIVGPLVPLLVGVKKPGGEPVILRGTEFNLPLDGDLTKLDARLRLELGDVTCALLPGLGAELPGLVGDQLQNASIPPIELTIEHGLVRYDRLPIRVDGRPMVLQGTYDLAAGAFDLSADVRLGDLGGDAGRALREVRKVLGDDYLVPVRLGGTKQKPKLSLASGFLEKAVKDAGAKALEQGLGKDLGKTLKDLLGG